MDRDLDQLVIDRLAGLPGPSGKTYDVIISPSLNEPAHVIFGVIRISSSFLRYLWWSAALFLLRYRASFISMEAEVPDGEKRWPLADYDGRLRTAYHNHAASRSSVFDTATPADLVEVELSRSEMAQVDNLFLRAVAWIIYHETAHLELGHESSTVENEHEADRYATESIAAWPDEEDEGRSSRFGQMAAMTSLMSLQQSELQSFSEMTHPHVYRRALQRLEQFGLDENSDEHHFSTLMLRGELFELGVDMSDEPQANSVLESLLYHVNKLESFIEMNSPSAAEPAATGCQHA